MSGRRTADDISGVDIIMVWMFGILPINTDVAIYAFMWSWGKTGGSLDAIPSVTMGSYKSTTVNEY